MFIYGRVGTGVEVVPDDMWLNRFWESGRLSEEEWKMWWKFRKWAKTSKLQCSKHVFRVIRF